MFCQLFNNCVVILCLLGRSSIDCLFNKICKEAVSPEYGVVDSLKALIMHETFIKPYSEEYILAMILIIKLNF